VHIEVYQEGVSLSEKGLSGDWLRHVAVSCAERLGLKNARFSIIVTDDAYIRNINREFRNDDRPTDVISFSNRENPFPAVDDTSEEIGEIYISLQRAEAQATEYMVSFVEETKRLIVHGILHLAGYDHERSDQDEELMLGLEEELCRTIE